MKTLVAYAAAFCLAAVVLVVWLSGSGSLLGPSGPTPIATVTFDFVGEHKWYSFPPLPSDRNDWPERVANRTYSWLNVKTPQTRYLCVWRDIGTTQYSREPDVEPETIFLTCNFGPKDAVDRGESLETLSKQRLTMRAAWSMRMGSYVISRLEVDLKTKAGNYRSQNLLDDVSQVEVHDEGIVFPATKSDPMTFNFRVALPARYNSRQPQKDPIVNFAFSGEAQPIPKWLNY